MRPLIAILMSLTLLACSKTVPADKVYGTYVASYPFGTETLSLNHDGSFTQRVEIKGESPLTASGTWSFDAKESRITLRSLLIVVDGFGHLNSDWGKSSPGIASLSVERLWFKINIGSGGEVKGSSLLLTFSDEAGYFSFPCHVPCGLNIPAPTITS